MSDIPIVFEPIAMERVWGGRRLEALYGKSLPPGSLIGEIWEIVDRREAQSVVHQGRFRGLTLHELWTGHRSEVFGEAYAEDPSERFPLLVKLLDARERLSLQVHPPAHLADALAGEPKTEVWYFAKCAPGSQIYAGIRKGIDRQSFETKLRNSTVEDAVHAIPVSAGDSIFIPSGRMHAIGEGNVIVEIQQNSDTTYRVFDWNRHGLDGKPRQLHIEESLACTDFEDIEPDVDHFVTGTIADCEFFRVEKISVKSATKVVQEEQFALMTVLEGSVTCGGMDFSPSAFFLVPADHPDLEVAPVGGEALMLRTTLPLA